MLLNEMAESLVLEGLWEFKLGDENSWSTIGVPGCWEAQGFSRLSEGPACYRRLIEIPAAWQGKKILVEFEAVSYAVQVRWNGVPAGEHTGLWTPFVLDVTGLARCGETNLLELEVYKPGETYPMRSSLAGFLPDVATTFGGIWQPVRLLALEAGISDFTLLPDYVSRKIQIQGAALLQHGSQADAEWQVEIWLGEQLLTGQVLPEPADGRLDTSIFIPNSLAWSPERPTLYQVQLSLHQGGKVVARASRKTGFRRLWADGNRLMFNDAPFKVRGILSWGWEPERIAPNYTHKQAVEEIRRVKEMGFNLIKLCLFVPNQAYYDAADEEGMLLWQEWPLWLPVVTPQMRAQAPSEYRELTRLTQPHPSVALYSLGCEMDRSVDAELLDQLNHAVRSQVSNVLVCDNSGSGESYGGLEIDLSDFTDYHPYYDLHYFEPLLDNWRRDWQQPRPWIFGEFCDSDTFRDLDALAKASEQPPWWMTADNPVASWRAEAQALLQSRERLGQADSGFTISQLVQISYARSWVIRKYTLEALARRDGIGGYVVTGLRDTPISTSGLWDDFGNPKWLPKTFRQINGEAVLSLDVGRRRRWRFGGDRPSRLDPHNLWAGKPAAWHVIFQHSGREIAPGSALSWALKDEKENYLASGVSRVEQALPPGRPLELGRIEWIAPGVTAAKELSLEVKWSSGTGMISNCWPVWIYPTLPAPPAALSILDPSGLLSDAGDWLAPARRLLLSDDLEGCALLLSTVWDDKLLLYVARGGKLLLLQQGGEGLPASRVPFWREGVSLFPEHPVWKVFPQQGHADLQFFGMAGDAAFDTTRLAEALGEEARLRPVMRRLDARAFTMSEYIFEARVGSGLLLGCSLRLQGGAGAQPYGWERNPAGAFLLWTMLDYLAGAGPA